MQGSQGDSALAAIPRLPRSSASAITRPRFPESAGRTSSSHQSPSVFFHRTPNRLFTCTKELNARSKPRKPTRGSRNPCELSLGKHCSVQPQKAVHIANPSTPMEPCAKRNEKNLSLRGNQPPIRLNNLNSKHKTVPNSGYYPQRNTGLSTAGCETRMQ